MSQLEEIRRRIAQRQEALEAALAIVVPQLAQLGALRVVLFGSLADGTVDSDSDLDLLVIMPDHRPGKEWGVMVYSAVERPVATDFLVFNQSELSAAIPQSTFIRGIIATGRIVYERQC